MEIQTTKYIDKVTFVLNSEEIYVNVHENEDVFTVDEDLTVKILSSSRYFRRYHKNDDYSIESEKIQNIIKNFWETYKDD